MIQENKRRSNIKRVIAISLICSLMIVILSSCQLIFEEIETEKRTDLLIEDTEKVIVDLIIPEVKPNVVLLEPASEINPEAAEIHIPEETIITNPVSTLEPTPTKEPPTKVPTATPKATISPTITPKPTTKPTPKPTLTPKPSSPTPVVSKDTSTFAKSILKSIITKDMEDVDKVKAVHDYIVLNTAYDYDNLKKGTIPSESFTIEGVLYKGIAVCQGYAFAFQMFMDLLGIDSKIVVGTADGVSHAWNMVSLKGDWYHVDVTWDDPVPDREGVVQYNYFLVTDAVMEVSHIWERENYPACNSIGYRYFVYNQYIVESINQYESKFMEQYNNGETKITVLYPEEGLPKFDFLWKFYRSGISYYEPWRLGDYTVLTVMLD